MIIVLVTACRAQETAEEASSTPEIAGNDWRTWGLIDDSVDFNDGESLMHLLVCIHPGYVELYYDTEQQALFTDFEFVGISDDTYEQGSMSCIDLNDDGCDELEILMNEEDGTQKAYVWEWDPEQPVFVPSALSESQ